MLPIIQTKTYLIFMFFVLFLGIEMVGGPWKTYIGIGLEFPWAFGYSILAGIGFVLRVSFYLKRKYT